MFSLGRQTQPCGYCHGDGNGSISDCFYCKDEIDGGLYELFLEHGFRRSGRLLYRPSPDSCCTLKPLRVPVEGFQPTRSQRKMKRRCDALNINIVTSAATFERDSFGLFCAYQAAVHHENDWTEERYSDFLVNSPLASTFHQKYFLNNELIAVGMIDTTPSYISSVYFFYKAIKNLSLGTYGALCEIEYAKATNRVFYTLGLWNPQCPKLDYKAKFGPAQVLEGSKWIELTSDTNQIK